MRCIIIIVLNHEATITWPRNEGEHAPSCTMIESSHGLMGILECTIIATSWKVGKIHKAIPSGSAEIVHDVFCFNCRKSGRSCQPLSHIVRIRPSEIFFSLIRCVPGYLSYNQHLDLPLGAPACTATICSNKLPGIMLRATIHPLKGQLSLRVQYFPRAHCNVSIVDEVAIARTQH